MTNLKHQENNELVYKFQNGDDLAFTELYNNNIGLIGNMLRKYSTNANLRYVDQDSFESAANLGFMKASKTYSLEEGMQFSSHCSRLIEQEMLRELQYFERYGRKQAVAKTESINAPKKVGDGEMEMIESLNLGGKDSYFEKEFPSTSKAIEYALLYNNVSFKDYILDIACDNCTQAEIVEQFGVSKQVVSYQIKTFKKKVKEYLDNHRVDSIDLMS